MLRRAQLISTLLELVGFAALVVGVAQFCIPAAWIVAGVALAAIGYALGSQER